MKEMIRGDWWLIIDKNPLSDLYYQFEFTMYRLNKRQETRDKRGDYLIYELFL